MKLSKSMKALSVFLIVILLVFNACSSDTENIVGSSNSDGSTLLLKNKRLSVDDYNLDVLAKGLAIIFNDENNRKVLEYELRNSQKVEHILEATEFLESVKEYWVDGIKKNQTLKSILSVVLKGKEREEIERTFINLEYGIIDIYMPIKEQFENWSYNQQLFIAPIDIKKAEKAEVVKAFDLNANEVSLSTVDVPELPTLIVTFSEKRGNYNRFTNLLSPKKQLSKINSQPAIFLREIRIGIDYDSGWFGGEMEIYIRTRINGGSWTDSYIIHMYQGAINVVGDGDSRFLTYYSGLDYVEMLIMEDDGWLTFDDDLVADENWDQRRFGYTDTIPGDSAGDDWYDWSYRNSSNAYNMDNMNNGTTYGNIQVVDGTYGTGDYDYLILGYKLY